MADYSAGNLELKIEATFEKAVNSSDKLIKNLETMMALTGSLTKELTALGKSSSSFGKIGGRSGGGSTNNNTSNFNVFKIFNKIYAYKNYSKQFFQSIKNGLMNAVDYTETLNLWQVAMKGNRTEAEKFVQTMNKAYGVSEQTLMNYQAIFRNMLSSLGGVSENTTYALSEYLTQMALDYASLYNTSIGKAMTTFQSVLSGSVRPIRSIAGYDITETTIYQLYQQLGGTKTQRQLTQTEKRLLRIYAVFQQMERSGAIGDLGKTIENTANQLRVMSETFKEITTWVGNLIDTVVNPILPKISAALMIVRDVIKALAIARGYTPFEGAVEATEEYNEVLDEVQGKLLSFDRFEALNSGADDNALGIDTTILNGLQQYQSILSGVSNEMTELYNKWSKWWFEFDAEGKIKGLSSQAKLLVNILELLGTILLTMLAKGIGKKLLALGKSLLGITNSVSVLNNVLLGGILYSFIKAIELFSKGDKVGGALAITIGTVLVAAYAALTIAKHKHTVASELSKQAALQESLILTQQSYVVEDAATKWGLLGKQIGVFALTAVSAFGIVDTFINSLDGSTKTFVSVVAIVVGGLGTILGLILAIRGGLQGGLIGAAIAGLGVGALIAGIKGVATANSKLQAYKNGGVIEDGVFTMSRGEIVGNFDDGTTVVANNQQIIEGIRQGVYEAVSGAMGGRNSGVGNVYLDGRKVGVATAQSSGRENIRTGLMRANR